MLLAAGSVGAGVAASLALADPAAAASANGGTASSPTDTIQLRRDTAANWTSVNPTLATGEVGLATDVQAGMLRAGPGAWNSLRSMTDNLGVYNVKHYGAKGDGTTNDAAAINAAITAANTAGGGTVFLPPGVYIVNKTINAAGVLVKSNVRVVGSGRDATTIRSANAQGDMHVLIVADATNAEVRDLTVDGNRAGSGGAGGHGVSIGNSSKIRIVDVRSVNGQHYGVGMQSGTMDDIWIDGVLVEDCGGDGIDIKDWNSANRAIRITNCVVRRFGRKGDQSYAGIDIRGLGVNVSGCFVDQYGDLGPTLGATGIRCRFGESDVNSNWWGAHYSQISNCTVRAADTLATGTGIVFGFHIESRGVNLDNCVTWGAEIGFYLHQSDSHLTNCRAIDAKDVGFWLQDGTSVTAPSPADRLLVVACSSIVRTRPDTSSIGTAHFSVESANNRFVACGVKGTAHASEKGLWFRSTSSGNIWRDGAIHVPAGVPTDDDGTGNTIA